MTQQTAYECLENGGIDVIQVDRDGDQEEQFFTAAWTVDVLTGVPLLAATGLRNHIKVIHCITKPVVLVLSRHDNSVNELKLHPVDPTLLFSAGKFGSCFVSSGMANTVKIWDLEDEVVQTAIKKSYTDPRPKTCLFNSKVIQFPAFCSIKVHAEYVECVRMVNDLVLSKSTGNKVIFWKPNPSRGKDTVTVLSEYHYKDAELWFMKFGLDSRLEVMAVGNKKGVVSVFDLDAKQENYF
ncbi:hypothetical protein PsorP6_010273 [Peronosclerospora sorghi]|uniref:Uncharacterized protein n=1 Tax=Peronosclerospora sorghi TaxID=230839 RepID=A0ACC0VTF7_9STRA|nr:hypothetical protein PsorP6_010273 [Peronosclerospora sorghi]